MLKKELLFEFKSPSRDSLKVYGFRFIPNSKKKPKNKVAIVAAMNGDELNQLYLASKLVNYLTKQDEQNSDFLQTEILIVPSVNHFALNMTQRYWPLDKTDINMMFPGYELGETTQRIAAKLFQKLQGYKYGIILEDRKDKAVCIPYVKILESGYEDIELSKAFGLKFVHLKEVSPTDTGTLQYNWEIWNTKAFSLVYGSKASINEDHYKIAFDAMLRFLSKIKAINIKVLNNFDSNIVRREQIDVLKAKQSGIFEPICKVGDIVKKEQLIGTISDSLNGEIIDEIKSPADGVITCMYSFPLIFQNSVSFRIAHQK